MKILEKLKCLKDQKGGYVVEASVTLPLVILAIATIASLISVEQTKESIYHSASEELRYSMIASYSVRDEIALPIRLEHRLKEEHKGDKVTMYVKGFYVDSNEGDTNDLIKFFVYHKTDLNFPLSFGRTHDGIYKFAGRKFTGDNMKKKSLGFEALESVGERNIVYVFPQSGEKYHQEQCRYLIPQTDQVALSPMVMIRYKPCNLCKHMRTGFGNTVYIFPEYGNAYHYRDCPTVKKKL